MKNWGDKLWEMLEPITSGRCDGRISSKNPEVNLNLALGYLLRAIFNIADNNHDYVLDYKVRREDDGTITVIDLAGNVITDGSRILREKNYNSGLYDKSSREDSSSNR